MSKEEEKIVKRKTEGNGLQIELVRRVPELRVSPALTKEEELKNKESEGRWLVGPRKRRDRKRTSSWKETLRQW